jgi:hypothetical protein
MEPNLNLLKGKSKIIPTVTKYTLLDLAPEVLVNVLAHIPVVDLFDVQWTCRTIYDIIAGSSYLQYVMRAYINGVDDFLSPDFPHSERLKLLRRYEQSRDDLQLSAFTKSVTDIEIPDDFILQGGYLIYHRIRSRIPQYGYVDLCSAARDDELNWTNILMDISLAPNSSTVAFAVDHDLVSIRYCVPLNSFPESLTCYSKREQNSIVWVVQLNFFQFTTGAPHPLSSTPTVSLPQYSGSSPVSVRQEPLGDHILVTLWNPNSKTALYLVSWKTGAVTFVSGSNRYFLIHDSRRYRKLREYQAMWCLMSDGAMRALIINDSLIAMMKESQNSLEICKLETDAPCPHLSTVCHLELPPLRPDCYISSCAACKEWVPTSKEYAQYRSSLGYHTPFYSSTVRMIGLLLEQSIKSKTWQLSPSHKHSIIIDTAALLSVIPADQRDVPWVEWGPSSTHVSVASSLKSAGPFWIMDTIRPVIRQYDLLSRWYDQSTTVDASSKTGPPVFSSEEVSYRRWKAGKVKTNLPYRDIVVHRKDFDPRNISWMMGGGPSLLADREWFVWVSSTVRGFFFYGTIPVGV